MPFDQFVSKFAIPSFFSECLAVYKEQNGNHLPTRIIVYREGQLDYVADANSLEIDGMVVSDIKL
jgi:hypothetical protein